jgi:hypothetical protein
MSESVFTVQLTTLSPFSQVCRVPAIATQAKRGLEWSTWEGCFKNGTLRYLWNSPFNYFSFGPKQLR